MARHAQYKIYAKCPKCEKMHMAGLDVEWTGRTDATPRIRCAECNIDQYNKDRSIWRNFSNEKRRAARRVAA